MLQAWQARQVAFLTALLLGARSTVWTAPARSMQSRRAQAQQGAPPPMGRTWSTLSRCITQSAMKAARSASLMGLQEARRPSPNMTKGFPVFTRSTCTGRSLATDWFDPTLEREQKAQAPAARHTSHAHCGCLSGIVATLLMGLQEARRSSPNMTKGLPVFTRSTCTGRQHVTQTGTQVGRI